MGEQRLIVGISGASGIVYGIHMLQALRRLPVETHLVMSRAAEMTLAYESDLKPVEVKALADVVHPIGDVGAAIASGSFRCMGMVIAPCSVRSLSEIAGGATATLLFAPRVSGAIRLALQPTLVPSPTRVRCFSSQS